ncbi:alpha/beta hydrolase [Mariniradius sediminis]|uniref:Alpha/beta hydrolase n=1 Tax=Mariniradius sediminis TaxID=2909237 RepID=A0ABS9BRD0_9BACT|nr:alpha/beta hydrolase [Mariniradius sediminis]MCF1749900.1 alpha/beta hydrolase [Mariniradius sediminis]
MKSTVRYEHTAFYRTSHVVKRTEKEIVFALHGYGQLSEFFMAKLQPLFQDDRLIVVPEATNYSYLKGYTGRIGANWMTSYEREVAIANNHRFLNEVFDTLMFKFKERPKITVMGFSQGAATASRWVSQLQVPIDRLILWSGGFAHDLALEPFGTQVQESEVVLVWGDKDEMLTPEAFQKQDELIKQIPVKVKKIQFDGGHELDKSTLEQLFARQS